MPQQMGIFDSLIARQTETFILKEKVLSLPGDGFDIKMANGQPCNFRPPNLPASRHIRLAHQVSHSNAVLDG